MTRDPTRLTVVGATELERRLLEAAAAEQPSPEKTRRMAAALGLSAAAGLAAPATAKAAAATTKAIWAWASAGALAAAVTAGAVGVWMSSRPPVTTPSERVSRAAAPAAPLAAPAPFELGAATRSAAPARRHAGAATRAGDLPGEIALIDAARAAIRAGAPERALVLLRRYGATYSGGTFRPEAAALRIEALAASGQVELARTLARDFVAKHPDSPLSERVARLAGTPPG